jgi:hypothetical protein
MTFKLLLFATRKPTLTPAEFRTHWETVHTPLIQSIAGSAFPLSHTRRYIARTPSPSSTSDTSNTWPAAVLVGAQEDFSYDGIAELVFEDQGAFEKFMGVVSGEEAAKRIADDEEAFLAREKLRAVVLGETESTSRE